MTQAVTKRAVMIQGTGSNVGKSMLVAGICRALARRGLRVAPFKPQNMSNNAAVTDDGGEIGRAQALQARACGLAPHVDMNPVLLKPESESGAQVIVQGKRYGHLGARDFGQKKESLLPRVLESFDRLCTSADIVIIEGAGSPAETNLRQGDIANMGFATAAQVPVVLIGDIDRGGVIAQIVGTHAVLSDEDRAMIKGFAVNKFRGNVALFKEGEKDIAARTGWSNLGTLPWFQNAYRLPAEDALDIESRPGGAFKIAVPELPRIANFDDLDPLAAEPAVSLTMIAPGHALPGDADLILLPGSKSTIADLKALRQLGWDIDIAAHIRRGGHVMGICGGFQMLGRWIADPEGIEGPAERVPGLGHLDIETVLQGDKTLRQVQAETTTVFAKDSQALSAYEIHLGATSGPDCARAPFVIDQTPDGAMSPNGRIMGSYLHGMFASDGFRSAFLNRLGAQVSELNFEAEIDATLDALADHIEAHLDLEAMLAMAEKV